ncbi:hypothetical protein HDU82_001372 [Entophlyctis luteolus]|nr:hypothetical protein HDU82_001372 [Entophlyctis luteolus]
MAEPRTTRRSAPVKYFDEDDDSESEVDADKTAASSGCLRDDLDPAFTPEELPATLPRKLARRRMNLPIAAEDGISLHGNNEWLRRRDTFLWKHRSIFLPLLPPDQNNHFDFLLNRGLASADADIVAKKPFCPPPSILATLKDYQLVGLEFLSNLVDNGMNGMLGDEMGLGKTLQTISLLCYMRDVIGLSGPYLIVCPLSVLSSWEAEIRRWAPSMRFIRFHGPANERNSIKKRCAAEAFDIYLTTYEQIVAEVHWFRVSRSWRCVVLDEGHRIKNDKANMSAAVFGIPSQFRFILTGTPLQNNLRELWALFHYLYPSVFTQNTAKFFSDSFDLSKGKYNHQAIESARKLLELVMIRRLKTEVDLSIPPREELIIYLPLAPMQRFWYKKLLTRLDAGLIEEIFSASVTNDTNESAPILNHSESTDSLVSCSSDLSQMFSAKSQPSQRQNDWRKLMNLLIQLRKICNHPYILPNAEPEPFTTGEHLIDASSKLMFLDKLLPQLFESNHRVLLFSQFTRMLDIVSDYMALRGISSYKVFLISTKAGGLGINLTSADTIIMLDSDWNPQNDLQAMARAHRIGQKKNVCVYRLICKDTVEEQMLTRLQKKLVLSLVVTAKEVNSEDRGDDAMPNLSKDDLLTIFRYGMKIAEEKTDETTTDSSSKADTAEILSFMSASVEEIVASSRAHADAIAEQASSTRASTSDILSGQEAVKSRFFEGRDFGKSKKGVKRNRTNADIMQEWLAEQEQLIIDGKRQRIERTVAVGNNMVLKELEACEQWEAAPVLTTIAARTAQTAKPSLNETKGSSENGKSRKGFEHQEACIVCDEPGHVVLCSGCPRVVHPKCVGSSLRALERQVLYFCPQHYCCICERKTQDAGGLLFRCGTCANAYCEDCLPVDDDITEIGESMPQLVELGYGPVNQAYFITCPACLAYEAEKKAIDGNETTVELETADQVVESGTKEVKAEH